MPELEPIDRTHAEAMLLTNQIRQHVTLLKDRAANWQPGPMPQEWGKFQPTRHTRRMR